MAAGPESWSTQQLAEFMALVSSFPDERSATRGAVERTAEALEAEVAALVRDGDVVASIGFAAGDVPSAHLAGLLGAGVEAADLPGVGPCRIASVALDDEEDAHLVVARADSEPFGREEADLLRGMARVLTLTVRLLRGLEQERELRSRSDRQARENARLLDSLRGRQRLLERLSAIQRKIVLRATPAEVLDTVVAGVRELIGDGTVGLRLVDPRDERSMVLVASAGDDDERPDPDPRAAIGTGAPGRAISEDTLVVDEAEGGMAVPVREHSKVVGSLAVGGRPAGPGFTQEERVILGAFAEHASLALTDAKTVEDALHQAFHDSLTDLPNRALFADRLGMSLARAERTAAPVAVLFLDLDRFKNVNDSLGHASGDQLLIAVAARLRECIRPGDTASRFGGDEFAVLLDQVPSEREAERVALRVLTGLEAPFTVAGREVFISASIGIALGRGAADDPVRDADLAMYRAKAEGKGRFARFEPMMHTAVVQRVELEADLQRAIERDELTLHYQPIVELRDGAVLGVEALLRWRHPTRGLLSPCEFIPLAEETGLMPQLDSWVLGAATEQAAEWRAAGSRVSVAVNVSGDYLQSPAAALDVEAALGHTGLAPDTLVLEITETVLMRDVEATIRSLEQLKALGVRLAVDDFGTGYSSLQYLRRFPIDILKIDKTFVDDLAAGSEDASLARAIVDLGQSFGLSVVAEGIECEQQRTRLLELGCALGQGFLFARPADAEAVGELVFAGPRVAHVQ